MLGAPLPPAPVARTASFRVRLFQVPPKDRTGDMIRSIHATGELPKHARPKELASFTVQAVGEHQAREKVSASVAQRGYTVRAINRGTGSDFVVYVAHPEDTTPARRS